MVLVGLTAGCHKKVKVEFERPAAVATLPEPEPMPQELETPPTEPADTVGDPTSEEPPPAATVSPPKPAPPRRAAPEPLPSPEPRPPRLSSGAKDPEEERSIRNKLDRAQAILSLLEDRALSAEHREQAAAARAFVGQALKALDEGDLVRASVLAEKGLILAEDVRASSRVGAPRAEGQPRSGALRGSR